MPPISCSRSAPLMSCSSPAARRRAIQARKSCRSFTVDLAAVRVLTAVSMRIARPMLQPSELVVKRQVFATGASQSESQQSGNRGVLHGEDQPLAFAAAAADHDLCIRGLFFLAQHRVMVLRASGNDAGFASAAYAELAGII